MEEKTYKLEFTKNELDTIWACAIKVCKDGINTICEGMETYLVPRNTMILASIYLKITDALKEGD